MTAAMRIISTITGLNDLRKALPAVKSIIKRRMQKSIEEEISDV